MGLKSFVESFNRKKPFVEMVDGRFVDKPDFRGNSLAEPRLNTKDKPIKNEEINVLDHKPEVISAEPEVVHVPPPPMPPVGSKRNNEEIDTLIHTMDYLKQNNPELSEKDIADTIIGLKETQRRRRVWEHDNPRPVTLTASDAPPLARRPVPQFRR